MESAPRHSGLFNAQTARPGNYNSFHENQAVRSRSDYSEWVASQKGQTMKGSYHEKMRMEDLKYIKYEEENMESNPKL